MPSPIDEETPFPALNDSSFNAALARSHLSPDDAFISPPRRHYNTDGTGESRSRTGGTGSSRSRSRRRKRTWKKLMWVKQSCRHATRFWKKVTAADSQLTYRPVDPDNYTDQATFLGDLQRNPRLKPYDFWPLVADSTVILQHACSVIVFVVCFVGIFQERVSPVSVVSYSSFATFVGWILWERWVAMEEEEERAEDLSASLVNVAQGNKAGGVRRRARTGSIRRPPPPPLMQISRASASSPMASTTSVHVETGNAPSLSSTSLLGSALGDKHLNGPGFGHTPRPSQESIPSPHIPVPFPEESILHQRMGTIKSAILIYCTLLGLSPILKSLTRSTSSDSIWAISFWLLVINVFFFDYSGGVGVKFPASLSTNAALMASTVLASRLPSTNQVFSLTLFSIEVFGLFPVFRRHVKHRSWKYHIALTTFLVLGAGYGMGMVLGDPGDGSWSWRSRLVGMVVAVLVAVLATGGCSWWLIGLQKYKNEIRGPWDPARPIIMSRTRWDNN